MQVVGKYKMHTPGRKKVSMKAMDEQPVCSEFTFVPRVLTSHVGGLCRLWGKHCGIVQGMNNS